jgi:hypothetical protein
LVYNEDKNSYDESRKYLENTYNISILKEQLEAYNNTLYEAIDIMTKDDFEEYYLKKFYL